MRFQVGGLRSGVQAALPPILRALGRTGLEQHQQLEAAQPERHAGLGHLGLQPRLLRFTGFRLAGLPRRRHQLAAYRLLRHAHTAQTCRSVA